MIRSIWVLVAGAVLTGFFSTCVVLNGLFRRPNRACWCDRLSRRWTRLVLKTAGVRVKVFDADRVDWSQPAVVVANHQSWFDVFTLAAYLPGRVRFVAKEELSRIPVFGRAWRICGHISIDRSDRRRAIESLDRAAERVREESLTMTLFPEGTRSPDGRLYAFKKGAFILAIKTRVPVVPVGISGSREIMPKGSFRVRGGEVRIRVGEPIEVGAGDHRDMDRLRELSRRAVAALIEGEDAEVGSAGEVAPVESESSSDGSSGLGREESTPGDPKETKG